MYIGFQRERRDRCATKANKQEQSHFYARPGVPGDGSRRTAGKFLSNWPKHNECKVFLEAAATRITFRRSRADGDKERDEEEGRGKRGDQPRIIIPFCPIERRSRDQFSSGRIDSVGRAETRERFTWATRDRRLHAPLLSIRSPLSPFAMWAHARGTREHASGTHAPRFADSPIQSRYASLESCMGNFFLLCPPSFRSIFPVRPCRVSPSSLFSFFSSRREKNRRAIRRCLSLKKSARSTRRR